MDSDHQHHEIECETSAPLSKPRFGKGSSHIVYVIFVFSQQICQNLLTWMRTAPRVFGPSANCRNALRSIGLVAANHALREFGTIGCVLKRFGIASARSGRSRRGTGLEQEDLRMERYSEASNSAFCGTWGRTPVACLTRFGLSFPTQQDRHQTTGSRRSCFRSRLRPSNQSIRARRASHDSGSPDRSR